MNKVKIILVAIIILAGSLRFNLLGKIPSSLNWDEAAVGYDAYSILKTGKDQYGHFLPLTFRALNDFRAPLTFYATLPFIWIFGLNEFAVRFPSALLGTATVLLLFFTVLEIFKSCRFRFKLALLSIFFLAVSPWHIQFSRISSEHNLAIFFILGGIIFFLRARNFSITNLYLSLGFFGLSLFTYHSARIVSPLIFLSLVVIYKNEIKLNFRDLFILSVFCLLFIIPIFRIFSSQQSGMRFLTINDLNIEKSFNESSRETLIDTKNDHSISAKIFHNRRLSFVNYENAINLFDNYRSHFYLNFWLQGDEFLIYHAPNFGLIYFFDAFFILVGVMIFLFKFAKKQFLILPLLLFLAPIPASTAWGAPNSNRVLFMVIPLVIILSLGFVSFILFMNKKFKALQPLILIPLISIICFTFGFYLHQYFVHTNYELGRAWMLEKKLGSSYTEKQFKNYEQIVVSNNKTDWPYIFWLFYTKFDPIIYQIKGGTNSGDFRADENFSKYSFQQIKFGDFEEENTKILIIGWPDDFKPETLKFNSDKTKIIKEIRIIKTLKYPSGETALQAAENSYIIKTVPMTEDEIKFYNLNVQNN